MIQIILLLLFFSGFVTLIGQAFFPSESDRIALLQPIAGVAVVILAISSLFLLNISTPFVIVVLILLILPLIKIRFHIKRFFLHSLLICASVIFCFTPYLLINGDQITITGFMISNDSVIHSILSRSCPDNEDINSKVYTSYSKCATEYPIGSHSVVNLLSSASNIDNSLLIVPVSIFFTSLNSLIVVFILLLVTNKNKKLVFLVSPIIAASYFYLAIAFHGFLPQSAYVPFVLAFALILFESRCVLPNNYRVIILAIFSASSIVIYSDRYPVP